MKRAQNADQKRLRRQDIIEKAREFLLKHDYGAIRLADLAESLHLVKGTLYRYFATRQDLFMALYQEELEFWLQSWSAGGPQRLSLDQLKDLWSQTLILRPLFTKLLGNFHTQVEPDLSRDGLRDFKIFLRDYMFRAARLLESVVPELVGKGADVLVGVYILIQGAAPLCFPNTKVQSLLDEEPDLAFFRFEFGEIFPTLLSGYLNSFKT